jgi:hypothetical protein
MKILFLKVLVTSLLVLKATLYNINSMEYADYYRYEDHHLSLACIALYI